MTLYAERAVNQTDHFADAFVAKTLRMAVMLCLRYDIQKFIVDAILFREIQCKKRDILMF